MKIGVEHLDDLSLGSVFLATGGGGDPYVAQLVAKQVLSTVGPADMVDANDLPDDAHVVSIGGVGAPTVSLELLPSVQESLRTLDAFEKHTGRKVDAVVSFEIGGGNSLIPIIAAAQKGIPVIDGDGMGRALPEAQMMTYAIDGVKPTPAVAVDYQGGVMTFETSTTEVYERQVRAMAMTMGGMITTAEHPMTGAEVKKAIIPGTVSFSIEVGRVLRENRGNAELAYGPLKELFDGSIYGEFRQIYTGKVTDKATRIIGGYDIGEATIEAFDSKQKPLHIDIKNEYLVARQGDQLLASVPDLVVIVDYETATPINAERLRYGQRVTVFAVGCPQYYRSKKALDVVAPKYFGFDFDYIPLEELPNPLG